MICPVCGTQVPGGARFCPSCGHALEAATDQRRVVTVLFADLVGFTGMSEARDPEHVKILVDRCFERLAADVTAYGGKVDKIVGDAIVALFGAPIAHEDDAERAVRAALQMQRTVDDYAADVGVDVRMRIGVNTGEVLVGGLRAGDDYTAMGDVVNVANRLQTFAAPGQVVVGAQTYAATNGVVRYDPLGAHVVRGRGEKVEVWAAEEALAPPGYRPRRMATPLVGRDAEMGMLRYALDTAADKRRPHLLLLVGEAGVGKSRLSEELAMGATVDHDAAIYVGRCVPYGEANPWWPVSEILRQAFGVDLADPSEVSVDKVRRGVELATRDGAEAERLVDGLLYLMGFENPLAEVEPTRALDEAISAMAALIEAVASRRLLVLFLADLHWADQGVLDLVDRLMERLRQLPVVVVGTARPELQDRWTPEPARHNVIWLNLDPLDDAATSELIDALLTEAIPDELRRELLARSGGNPFFVEELLVLLSEAGVLDGSGGSGAASGPLRELPSSLRGLVAARLDGIDMRERAMLEDAAVIGRVGSVAALVDLSQAREEHEVAALLDGLVTKELLVVSDGRFEFKSDLVREVAYEMLTKSSRAERHAATAVFLAQRARKTRREDEFVEQIAHHYAEAARLVGEVGHVEGMPDDVRSKALDWLERAANRAETRDSALVAEQFFDDALGLLTADEDDRRQRLLLGRAAARSARHDLPGARNDVEEVLVKSEAAGDSGRQVRALTVRGEVEQKEGDVDAALATLEEAMALAKEIGDRPALAEALRHWGMVQLFRGELDRAESAIAEARDAFRTLEDRRSEAWALQNLAWIAFSRGESDTADSRLSEAAAMFEELSDWGGRSWALGLLGFVRLAQGRLEEAGDLAETVIDDARRAGDRWALGMTLVLRSAVRLWLGRTSEALDSAQQAREVFDAIDDVYGRSLAVANLTRASANLGRLSEARALVEEAMMLFERQGRGMAFMGASLQANVLCQIGDSRGALAASVVADEVPSEVPVELVVARALAFVQSGRADEALARLDRVLEPEGQATTPGNDGARVFAMAVRALALAATADIDGAVDSGSRVSGAKRGTYIDETYAAAGVALAEAQRGAGEAARDVLERALTRVDATEDRVSQAIIRLARARALEVLHVGGSDKALREARDRFDALGIDPYGWEHAFEAASSGGLVRPASP